MRSRNKCGMTVLFAKFFHYQLQILYHCESSLHIQGSHKTSIPTNSFFFRVSEYFGFTIPHSLCQGKASNYLFPQITLPLCPSILQQLNPSPPPTTSTGRASWIFAPSAAAHSDNGSSYPQMAKRVSSKCVRDKYIPRCPGISARFRLPD